jgi:hypothetical protein
MPRRLEGRNGSIYRAWVLGTTQEALAQEHGLHQTRVAQIIAEVRASIPEEDVAERRAKYLDSLDVLSQEMASIMDAEPTQAYSNGRPMFAADGTPILDYSVRMAAADRILKIGERASKVLGLDAAVKVDATVSEQADRAAEASAADAIARVLGSTPK